MYYCEIKPTDALAAFVKCYWLLEKDYTATEETIWPDGCIDVVMHSRARLHQEDGRELPAGFVIGPMTQPLILRANGISRMIGIRFYAYGAYPFFRMPICELTDNVVELGTILGAGTDASIADIADLPLQAACQWLDTFLLRRMAEHSEDMNVIRAATAHIYRCQGTVDVSTLARQVNLSHRSLERKFVRVVGHSPKTLARIARFDHIKNELMANPTLKLTDLAQRSWYFDQAHFIRDFQHFTAYTPSAFAKKVAMHQIYFYK